MAGYSGDGEVYNEVMATVPTLQDIRQAREVVGSIVHHTPLLPSRQLSLLSGADVLLKAENLQRTGSFKVRGATNKLASLSDEQRERGVIAASAGNHAQGVALAAREMGSPCVVVMPREASIAKVQATRGYGAQVVFYGDTFEEAMRYSQGLAQERGLTFVHAYDDRLIVAGQGTLGLEICEDVEQPDIVVVPVGGGGLIGGIAVAVKELSPKTRVVGVQAEAFSGAVRSFRRGRRVRVAGKHTLADGIAVAEPGKLPMRLIRRYVDQMVTVGEDTIAHAQVLLLERAKLLVEGAGAVGLAALLEGSLAAMGKKTVVVLSGGNVDMNLVSRILDHGLAEAGRFMVLELVLLDRPGRLSSLLAVLAAAGVNVLDVDHRRQATGLPVGQVLVRITGETRDAHHAREVVKGLEEGGYVLTGMPVTKTGERTLRFMAHEAGGSSR